MTTIAPARRLDGTELIDPVELAERLGLRRPTEEQAAVIGAPSEPALVTAGAGSGKTETMAARVVWLVANGLVRPEQVLGLTFTRKAAGQLADRVRRRLRVLGSSSLLDELDPTGDRRLAARAGEPTISTYHAYAGRLLAEHGLRLPVDPGARLLSPTASWQLAHRIVSTWAADLDTDRVPSTVTALVQSLAGELGEHLADASTLALHAERFARAVEDAPRAKGQKAALPVALANKVAAQRSGRRCSRWSASWPSASAPSAASTSPTRWPRPPASPRPTTRSGPPSARRSARCCSTSTRTPGTRSGSCCARCSRTTRAPRSPRSATPSSRSTAGAVRARRTFRGSSPTSRASIPTAKPSRPPATAC